MKTQVWLVDAARVDRVRIREAAAMLRHGKLVVFPTETVYGLGAALSQEEATRRIYELKERDDRKPLTWHLADYDYLKKCGIMLSPLAREMSWRFLPGPLTLIVPDPEGKTVGIRFPDHPAARGLIEELGEPVLATSVNKSGEESVASGKKAARLFDGRVDLVLDGGVTRFGKDSTVVDLSVNPPAILRRGPFADEVETFLKSAARRDDPQTERILFVCTGNTCRSVMAAGWLSAEIAKRGLADKISTASCGISALEGASATMEAIQVLRMLGADAVAHRARLLNKKLLEEASRVFAMTASHADAVIALDYGAASKLAVLGVTDPVGMDLKAYQMALGEIRERLGKFLPWLTA